MAKADPDFRRFCAGDLTPPRLRILAVIADRGPMRLQPLQAAAGIASISSLDGHVAALKALGLAAQGRARGVVALTPEGLAAAPEDMEDARAALD